MVAKVRIHATYSDVFFFYLLPEPEREELGGRHLGVNDFRRQLYHEIIGLSEILEGESSVNAEHSLMIRVRRARYPSSLFDSDPEILTDRLRTYYDYLFHLRYDHLFREEDRE